MGFVFLTEQRSRKQKGFAVFRHLDVDIVDARRDAQRRHEGLRRLAARPVEQVGKARAHELAGVLAEQGGSGGIRLDDSLVARVDDDNRFRGELEKQAIALFRIANARVLALHRLLRLGQTLLQRGHGAQVASNRDDASVLAVSDRAVADRNVRSLRGGMIDLSPARNLEVARFADHFLDFRFAFNRDRVRPATTDPVAIGLAREFLVAKRDIADHAIAVHDKRDVGGGDNQCGRGLGIDRSEAFNRCVEAGQRR